MTRQLGIGIDFGGTGIKTAAVALESGKLASARVRVKTPQPSTPERCIAAMVEIVAKVASEVALDRDVPVGVGVPAVVIDGVVLTATNIDDCWLGYDAAGGIGQALSRRTVVMNDADVAGIAEMQFGAGRGQHGTVLVITLGTGIGSALFLNGRLVPNTELGHIEVRGKDAEHRAAAVSRQRRKLSWVKWASEVEEFLRAVDMLVWPDLVIIGGGASKDADKFVPRLKIRPKVVPAELRNEAGIVGAALVAAGLTSPDTIPGRTSPPPAEAVLPPEAAGAQPAA